MGYTFFYFTDKTCPPVPVLARTYPSSLLALPGSQVSLRCEKGSTFSGNIPEIILSCEQDEWIWSDRVQCGRKRNKPLNRHLR